MTTATAPYPAPDIAAAVARGLVAANDQSNPDLDAGCSPQKYAGMAQDFRASAWEHLDKGDLPQASNKVWGLVAETVKAISAYHQGYRIWSDSLDMGLVLADSYDRIRNLATNTAALRLPESGILARRLEKNPYAIALIRPRQSLASIVPPPFGSG